MDSLDALADSFETGERIKFSMDGGEPQRGEVVGFVRALPRKQGEPDAPALVVRVPGQALAHVYPEEVTWRDQVPY